MNDLITEEEIEHVRSNAFSIELLKIQTIPEQRYYTIKSGYSICYSLDIYSETQKEPTKHISITTSTFEQPDPADAEIIARGIIGNEGFVLGPDISSTSLHFYACPNKEDVEKLKKVFRLIEAT